MSDKKPLYKIWVPGKPLNYRNGSSNIKAAYRQRIQQEAKKVVSTPWNSKRLDVEIWFASKCPGRPDVDNITKPILDALEGVVYINDKQIRSVKVGCISTDEAFEADKDYAADFFRMLDDKKDEFVIRIYYGMSVTHKKMGNVICYPVKKLIKNTDPAYLEAQIKKFEKESGLTFGP